MEKVLICGCGNIVSRWIQAILSREDAEIVGLCDVREESAARTAAAFGLQVPLYTELPQALAQSDAEIVVDTTPPPIHRQTVTLALRSGRDVFGEKPMADTLENARAMVAEAEKTGRRYFVMQNRRYLPGIRTLRAELDKGELGKLSMVNADMFLGAHFVKNDFRYSMEHPLLVDMAIHTFDEGRYLMADRPLKSAYCQEFNPSGSWYRHEASAVCVFETEDGVVFTFRGSWATRAENTTAAGSWHLELSEGAAIWNGADKVFVTPAAPLPDTEGYFEEEGNRRAVPLLQAGRPEHAGCIDAMFAARRTGASLDTECKGNLQSLMMVHACIRSSQLGRKVSFSEI